MISLYVLLGITLLAVSSLIYSALRNGITPMPSSHKAKDTLVKTTVEELCQVKTNPAVVIETGSGWGGVALSLAAHLPQARIQGYETSPFPYLISRLRAKLAGYSNLKLRFGDYRRVNLAAADILVCYLFPGGMQDIARLKLTSPIVISNTFALPDHIPDRRIQSGDTTLSIIYVYRPEQLR